MDDNENATNSIRRFIKVSEGDILYEILKAIKEFNIEPVVHLDDDSQLVIYTGLDWDVSVGAPTTEREYEEE